MLWNQSTKVYFYVSTVKLLFWLFLQQEIYTLMNTKHIRLRKREKLPVMSNVMYKYMSFVFLVVLLKGNFWIKASLYCDTLVCLEARSNVRVGLTHIV